MYPVCVRVLFVFWPLSSFQKFFTAIIIIIIIIIMETLLVFLNVQL